MLRPDVFAAVLGLARTASKFGDCWVQNDFCVRVKGASDDWPGTYEDPATSMEQVRDLLRGRDGVEARQGGSRPASTAAPRGFFTA